MQDGKHVILVVDDDPDLLDQVRLVLERHDYVMVDAGTAEEGLRAFKQSNPDLIIVDLMMEQVDAGTSLVKNLKMAGNAAPVYMLSSVGDNLSMSTDYTELGLAGVFQKPIDPRTLVNVLKTKLKN